MSLSGKVQTVLGLAEPGCLGRTLTHEHLKMDYKNCYRAPRRKCDLEKGKYPGITLETVGWVRQNPYSHIFNLSFGDEPKEDIIKEVNLFKEEGGSTICECTTTGISRSVAFCKDVSEATGVNIIVGTGFYIDHTLSAEVKSLTVEQMAQQMIKDITTGADGTDIKCGMIGEIGCSDTITSTEKKSLQATATAQVHLGAPAIIHPGRTPEAPMEAIRVLQEAGADINKTVISHLCRCNLNHVQLLELASTGCFLEYDQFGCEVSYYQPNPQQSMQSDAQRIDDIKMLVTEGYADKILVAHDIHTRHRLVKYGGHGYAHVNVNAVPKMLDKGISQEVIDKIQIENPKSWLAFK